MMCGSFVPFSYLICLASDVTVIDEQGNPVQGMNVRIIYQDYSLESEFREEFRTNDRAGLGGFEPREIRSTFAAHAAASLRSIGHTGFHASFGCDAQIVGRGLIQIDQA
jgi:hypothetical protein